MTRKKTSFLSELAIHKAINKKTISEDVKKIFLICLYTIATCSFSQEKNVLIFGDLIDSLGVVRNANIINLNKGTFSSDNGRFRIVVSKGDSLQISSIQHITKKIFINKQIIDQRTLKVTLASNTYVLDEFDLKRHYLMGRLGVDIKDVPTNKKDSILRNVMDFSKVNMKIVESDDYIDKRVRPQIVKTDPNMAFIGAGASVSISFKYSKHLWALRKKLALQKAFPYKVLSELGENFF
ncbi:MAG: hypothetical protein P8H93_03625 [Polaribacter sp.]|nr:hypothetical protein [Polaribacter sp.]